MMKENDSAHQRTAAIIARAMDDDAYRDELLANPKAAIQREFGKELPHGLEVRVVEESTNVVYLVLPPRRRIELTDQDLASVAGGFGLTQGTVKVPGTNWYPLDEWLTTVAM